MTLERSSFTFALLGHLSLLGLMFVQIRLPEKSIPAPPIIFELDNLEINEPQKTEEMPIPIPPKPPEAIKKTVAAMPDTAPEPEPEEAKPIEETPQQDAVAIEKEVQKNTEKKEEIPFPEIKPKTKPKLPILKEASPKPKAKENSLKTLLASVEKISERIEKQDKGTAQETSSAGSEKGTVQAPVITASELDFIATTIRKHWNLDAGVSGVDKMLIEVKVFLDMSGNVYNVEFLDLARYGKDTAYTSVADSAQRAIYICDKLGDESPFKKLAKKHNGAYSEWKELTLRFTP